MYKEILSVGILSGYEYRLTYYYIILTGVLIYTFPNPNQFNGSTDTSTGTGCIPSGTTRLACINSQPKDTKLTDGDIGPLHSLSMNLHRFFAWNRTQTQPVIIQFDFGGSSVSSLSSVVLYFFNSPAQRIGLPIITLRGRRSGGETFNISYIYDNNAALSESDSQLRNVSMRITSKTQNIIALFIDFVFNDTGIDWFLVSEVEICEGE